MRIILTLPIILAASPALAQDSSEQQNVGPKDETRFQLFTGVDHLEGDVGEGLDYETTFATTGVAVTKGRFSASASLPYISSTAPQEVIINQGGLFGTPLLGSSGTQNGQVKREGIGDLSLNAAYQLPVSGVNASVGASVKVPTASREKGLGTGKVDYGVSGQLSRKMGAVVPFVGASYTIIGEPENFETRNTLSGAAGSHLLLGKNSALTASYSYEQSASSSIGDSQSINMGFGTNLTRSVRIGVDGAVGLSDAAPDTRVGLKLRVGI
ncbi:transporter [Parasphingorhabdus flavimaris]|uniref:Transporter n=1 Tax=Parasphingorhabdus flavimaris TaxID=266812 RepID=A0ABX2N5D1_9SPHN|nr:transporter [Parasphingorhabdus flavimaris]NVD28884.1 transporter [Parasphingorhabdus flavimaris]|tara:strand:- start:4912 stop:5718 length:807 start_codon:yes stop_codon:yes gene_type:complete